MAMTAKKAGNMQKSIDQKTQLHERLWHKPTEAKRLVTFGFPSTIPAFDMREIFNNPAKSLDYQMRRLAKVLETEDDSIPMIRVEVGTGLPASAFGAELEFRTDNMPAVKTHPIATEHDLEKLLKIDLSNKGFFGQAYKLIDYFKKNKPDWVRLCQCDMQGPWNTAQLLMGDKIFYDIYDNIKLVCTLLDAVTDFMIRTIPDMKAKIGEEWNYFYLQGTKIPGASRLVNCSTDMISDDFYYQCLLERDSRFFEAMGGGMMHICGNNSHCIKHFNTITKLRGLEINFNYLDVFTVSKMLREDIVLICTGPVEYPLLTPLGENTLGRFCKGEFPGKKNILFHFDDPADLEKCKKLGAAVRQSNR